MENVRNWIAQVVRRERELRVVDVKISLFGFLYLKGRKYVRKEKS